MKISDIAHILGAHIQGNSEGSIEWLLTDSRSLCFPESTLFFALRTQRGNGQHYISQLYSRQVRYFVVDTTMTDFTSYPEATFLQVPDTLCALQQLAAYHRSQFQVPVIAITGSNGKTICKEWLSQLLSPDYCVTRSPRSYNSQIGVPLSLWQMWSGTELALIEAAISEPGEMDALQQMIRPTVGLFTCLGEAHQQNFESLHQKCMEKLRLFRDVEALIYPEDDEVIRQCIASSSLKAKLIPFHQVGDAEQDNRAACQALCRYLGMDEMVLQHRLQQLEPVAMRLEVIEGIHRCTLINDAYNSDLYSLRIALDFMNRRPERADKQRTLILSDIQQTGLTPAVLYAQVADLLNQHGVERFVGVGPVIASQAKVLQEAVPDSTFYATTEELLQSDTLSLLTDQLVLVKGAREFHFEALIDQLEHRIHETILEVNLSAIVENLNRYRSFLHPTTKMVCMVKADAYGMGAVQVAKTLQEHRVDYLAVAVADEGVELRRAGVTANILIMNPEMNCFRTLFRYHLEPEVYSFRLLEALIHAAQQEGVSQFPIHLKLDTGMHRMGFHPIDDMPRLIQLLQQQHEVIPRSVFSHFVGSDSDDFDDFSAQQYQLFLRGSEALQAAFSHTILRHICNSAGIEHFPERQHEMVRLGLGLYGINPRNNQLLANVCKLRTTILQIHDVPAGESVGYSRRTYVQRPSRIASLPIGYADGLNRRLGNRAGYCLINGFKAHYVGNICMDVCMVDVTDIPCQEGDSVLIFGEELSPSVLAEIIGTIPYEVLTSISPRVKRLYFQE